ncbi:MAG: hypothetical protein QGG26_01550 [Candidatus Undinarchaeales archaeon]|nr:hypothetical protein [Candidatus Undinarchaeales archaeon]
MTRLLMDEVNLRILKEICSGTGLFINLSYLSRKLKKHRNTIKVRVNELLESKIINPPIFPFFRQYKAHPLLIIILADLPPTEDVLEWMRKDKHIFAAFKIRQGSFNTLLIQFQKDILNYQLWREHLVTSGRIPPRDIRTPSEAHFYSNQLIVKYEPSEGIKVLKQHVERGEKVILNGIQLTEMHVDILESVLKGEGIGINETVLARTLEMHKKTIRRRIDMMLKEKTILEPVCRFHSFIVPPGCVLQITKVEIRKNKKDVLRFLKNDPHIPMAFHICEGRFNYLLFEVFYQTEDRVEWSSHLRERFIGAIGLTETIVLMEKNTYHIDQQKVSLGAINDSIKALKHKKDDYFSVIEPDYLLFDE